MAVARTAFAVRTLVLGAVVLGTAGFVTADKAVTVVIDGDERALHTYSATVGDLLADEGHQVGPHDSVVPAPDAAIADGSRIVVRTGRLVVLTVDGVRREIWTTASTLEELTASLGGRYAAATTTASRSARIPLTGFALDLRLPKSVTVVHDGTSTFLQTTAPSVAAVLFVAGVQVAEADLLSTDLTLAPVDGLIVTVVRVTTDQSVTRKRIPFSTKKRADASLYRGVTKVVKKGRAGLSQSTYVLTLHDGAVVSKASAGTVVLRRPVARVVAYGTKARPSSTPTRRSTGGVDSLNWGALAYCESSGNPRAIGGGGIYFGLYQFNLSTWRGVGGTGNPIDASRAEQTYRAKLLYRDRGAQPWPTCGPRLFT